MMEIGFATEGKTIVLGKLLCPTEKMVSKPVQKDEQSGRSGLVDLLTKMVVCMG